MSDKVDRSVRVAVHQQFLKDHEEAWDKAFAAERERCRLLDEGDRKYYE